MLALLLLSYSRKGGLALVMFSMFHRKRRRLWIWYQPPMSVAMCASLFAECLFESEIISYVILLIYFKLVFALFFVVKTLLFPLVC